jgi:hypothetical protein
MTASGQLPAYRSGRKVIRIKTADLDRIFRRIPPGLTKGELLRGAFELTRPSERDADHLRLVRR